MHFSSLLRSLVFCAAGVLIIYSALRSTLALIASVTLLVVQLVIERLRPTHSAPLTTFFRTPTGLYLTLAILFAILALGPEIHQSGVRIGTGLWAAFTSVPGFSSVRTPSRLFFITSLAAAILAAFGLARLLAATASRNGRIALFALALFGTLAESWSAPLPLRRYPTLAEAPPVYRWLAAQPGPKRAIVELPVEQLLERRRMYFANIHKRPTVDAESSFGLPSLGWVSHGSFVSGAAALHFERLAVAGLQYAVLHKAELPRQFHDLYLQTLARGGAHLVATLGADDVYEVPSPASLAEPLSPTSTTAFLQVTPSALDKAPLSVFLHLAPRLDVAVFEPGTRRFDLRFTVDSVTAHLDTTRKLFLSPPLIAPASVETINVEIPFALPHGAYRAGLRLSDDRGLVWIEQETTFLVSDAQSWPGLERAFTAPTPCAVVVSLPHRGATGAKRVLVVVTNVSASPWVGPNRPELQVAEVSPDGARAAPQPSKLPPMASGSSTPVTVHANPLAVALEIAVRFPNAASPACANSVRLQ